MASLRKSALTRHLAVAWRSVLSDKKRKSTIKNASHAARAQERLMDGQAIKPLRARLIELVDRCLASKSVVRTVAPEDDLTEIGLDSMGMVNLMLAIEAEFAIMIAPADITPENLRSVATIEALIAQQAAVS
jgi:acyl carrier protein